MKSIKELVKQYGSQQRLADAMGVHRPQVSRWVKLNAHIDEEGNIYIKTRSVNPVDGLTNEWRDVAAKALADALDFLLNLPRGASGRIIIEKSEEMAALDVLKTYRGEK